jgi:hypothetical protein
MSAFWPPSSTVHLPIEGGGGRTVDNGGRQKAKILFLRHEIVNLAWLTAGGRGGRVNRAWLTAFVPNMMGNEA